MKKLAELIKTYRKIGGYNLFFKNKFSVEFWDKNEEDRDIIIVKIDGHPKVFDDKEVKICYTTDYTYIEAGITKGCDMSKYNSEFYRFKEEYPEYYELICEALEWWIKTTEPKLTNTYINMGLIPKINDIPIVTDKKYLPLAIRLAKIKHILDRNQYLDYTNGFIYVPEGWEYKNRSFQGYIDNNIIKVFPLHGFIKVNDIKITINNWNKTIHTARGQNGEDTPEMLETKEYLLNNLDLIDKIAYILNQVF